MGEASISMFPQLAALALSAIVACSALPTSLVTDENVCTFIDFAQNVSQTCCLVPNPGYEKQNCYKGFEALNMGCCDTPQYWKQRGYDPSKQMGECYCAGGCFKTYNDKRAEMKCPKKQGLGAPLGGSCDPAGYVASIGTDGGDKGKCLEIKFGGGKLQSAFWLEEGWRYDPKREGKEWHDGKCDLTKFDNPAVTKDYAGWTEEKNGSSFSVKEVVPWAPAPPRVPPTERGSPAKASVRSSRPERCPPCFLNSSMVTAGREVAVWCFASFWCTS